MSQKTYDITAGVIFSLLAVGHLIRLMPGWEVQADGVAAPMWISVVTLLIAAPLAYFGLRLGTQK